MSGGPGNDPPETGRWWPDSVPNSYCKNFNTMSRSVSERIWPIHAQGMYKIFSFNVTLRQLWGVMYKNADDFLSAVAFSYREMPEISAFFGVFPALFLWTLRQKCAKSVVKTQKLSAFAPSFSEILFRNVDYLTRKCATCPLRIQYTESTNHPEHPCAVCRTQRRRRLSARDTSFIIVQEVTT